jgi:hypothetical protein
VLLSRRIAMVAQPPAKKCFEPLPSDGEACPDAAVMQSRLPRGPSIESSGERVGAKCCYFGTNRLGCPCGCDRSAAMTAELRERGGDAAQGAILATLKTIAEREDAGYITEAMLEHRLRLLDLRAELDPAGSVTTLGPRDRGVPPAEPRRHGELPMAQDTALRVTAELLAHGETTELVAAARSSFARASCSAWSWKTSAANGCDSARPPSSLVRRSRLAAGTSSAGMTAPKTGSGRVARHHR